MVTTQDVSDYLGGDIDSDVSALLTRARALLEPELGNQYFPEEVVDLAILTLCAELNQRKKNPGGIISYAGVDQLGRLNKDPMTAVRPILNSWKVKL